MRFQAAGRETKVYENYLVSFVEKSELEAAEAEKLRALREAETERHRSVYEKAGVRDAREDDEMTEDAKEDDAEEIEENGMEAAKQRNEKKKEVISIPVTVMVNGAPVVLTGKKEYVFVDIFNVIDFDLSTVRGNLVTTINGETAQYLQPLKEGDALVIRWE